MSNKQNLQRQTADRNFPQCVDPSKARSPCAISCYYMSEFSISTKLSLYSLMIDVEGCHCQCTLPIIVTQRLNRDRNCNLSTASSTPNNYATTTE